MFKANDGHKQNRLFGRMNTLPQKTQEKLAESIYQTFYEEVFCKIDEKKFECLYSDSP